jgi:NADPH:quinone reductase-like Zn-dependent oxidoreductase
MRAWNFNSANGGVEKNLHINEAAPMPIPKADQHLIRVLAASLNPVDYKVAEAPLIGRLIIPKNACPGIDVVGEIVKPASGSSLKTGQMVFGMAGTSLVAGGAMAQYTVVPSKAAAAVPEGADKSALATVGVAGMTAYQSIVPFVKDGSRIFINGGSGGTGVFGIQIAKAVGCHVTTSCSTTNVELCKSLGADEVLDYKQAPVLQQLKKQKPFDHIVDNVGADYDLYWKAHEYSVPKAKYVFVGATPGVGFGLFIMKVTLIPGFLGGGKRSMSPMFAVPNVEHMDTIAKWMGEGKVKPVIDQRFKFEQGKEAMEKMKSGRTKGKIVFEVAEA